jgi:hypothetical protein
LCRAANLNDFMQSCQKASTIIVPSNQSVMSKKKQTPSAPPAHAARPAKPEFDTWGWVQGIPATRVAIGLVVLAFLLRIPNLSALSLWVDEFVHVLRARDVANGTGPLLTTDNNGILLTILQVPLAKIFGAKAFWMRLPSVFFGLGMIWLLYRIGTELAHKYVGLLAAWMGVWSLYLVFWARISRNYAIFGFFFLLLAYVLIRIFQRPIKPLYIGLGALAAVAALLSHQLAFFFGISAGVFCLAQTIGLIRQGVAGWWRQPVAWVGILTLPALLLLMPGVNTVLRGPLSVLLSPQQLDWILPQSARLAQLWKEQRYNAWGVYTGTLGYDLAMLYVPAWLGLAAAWWVDRRVGAWMLAFAFVPLLLLGFLFREPALPRYFIFVHPFFLLSVALFFFAALKFLIPRMPVLRTKTGGMVALALPFVIVLTNVRWSELTDLLMARQVEGHVVDQNISQYNFTNWQDPCKFVKSRRQPSDLIISTVTTASGYYLDEPNVLLFRQMQYDTRLKQFRSNDPQPDRPSAATLQDLQRTVASAPSGWLLADYYFDNVFVSEEARQFVYKNMQFYPEASPDGSVMVFGWDRNRPAPQEQNMVVQLGLADGKFDAIPFNVLVTAEQLAAAGPMLPVQVRYQGVNSNREALIAINDNNALYLPANKGKGIEKQVLQVNTAWLRPGYNKFQILYEPKVKSDPDKGFVFYYLDLLK